jgi:hypothetical protein
MAWTARFRRSRARDEVRLLLEHDRTSDLFGAAEMLAGLCGSGLAICRGRGRRPVAVPGTGHVRPLGSLRAPAAPTRLLAIGGAVVLLVAAVSVLAMGTGGGSASTTKGTFASTGKGASASTAAADQAPNASASAGSSSTGDPVSGAATPVASSAIPTPRATGPRGTTAPSAAAPLQRDHR